MAIGRSKGTPDQFISAVKNRISELGGLIEESTKINAGTYCDQDGVEYTLDDLREMFNETGSKLHPDMTFEKWLQNSIDNGLISEVCDVTSCSLNCSTYQDMDGSFSGIGDIFTENELRDMYKDMKHYDPVVGQYDTFEEWLKDTVENGYLKIVESASDFDEVTHETVTAAEDVDRDRYLHTLIGDCDAELENEVDSTVWDNDEENIFLTVTYMDNVIELQIPFEDLDMDWDTIDSDVAYIVNSVLQDLDNLA